MLSRMDVREKIINYTYKKLPELVFSLAPSSPDRTKPNSALDLRRPCTSSMCEQSICKVKYTGMKSDHIQIRL